MVGLLAHMGHEFFTLNFKQFCSEIYCKVLNEKSYSVLQKQEEKYLKKLTFSLVFFVIPNYCSEFDPISDATVVPSGIVTTSLTADAVQTDSFSSSFHFFLTSSASAH